MTAKEMREYAVWLKNWYSCVEGGEYIFKKQLALCDYILANVPLDGEERIDDKWLETEWGFESNGQHAVTLLTEDVRITWHKIPMLFSMPFSRVSTRSQFRSLMAGLGVSRLVKPLDGE